MELTAYRDGIFSNSDPIANPNLTPYSDGSLGSVGPQAFRDGLFSQADPMAYPGSLLTAYSDGALGSLLQVYNDGSLGGRRRGVGNYASWAAEHPMADFFFVTIPMLVGIGVVGLVAINALSGKRG